MNSPGSWQVVVFDDQVNTVTTVAFVLYELCGLPIGEALDLPRRIHEQGSATVAITADRHEAEMMAARLQVHGVHGGVAPV